MGEENNNAAAEDQIQEQTQETQSTGENNSGEKTFTQAELSAVATAEKRQGKDAILKIFGVKDEKAAKEQAKAFKEWQDAQKTLDVKVKEQEGEISEANLRAQAAENKLACMMSGVNKDSIDDALAIAVLKVTEDKDLSTVLEEMKKEPRYKGFFGTDDSNGSKGTGTSAGHQGTGSTGSTENIGERLGKARKSEPKKSNFFTN